MTDASILTRLVDALRCLPGIGPKSAQRMVYHLLQPHRRSKGLHLATCLSAAMHDIQHCHQCNNYTEQSLCDICRNPARDKTLLCVVESPLDVSAIEQSGIYSGCYFVLMGKVSPLEGLGPEDIGLPKLYSLVVRQDVKEVILALNSSIEGITTIHFIYELLQQLPIKITQLAQGIPSGGELEYLDINTISNALRNRAKVNEN